MNTRLELLADGVKNIAACCCPYLRLYKVSHFDSEHKWVEEEVKAYSHKDAAKRLGLIAGRNCFVGRVIRRRP